MINRISKLVKTGGFTLAMLAGCLNAIGLLGFSHQAVSHLTGTTSLLSLAIVNQNFSVAMHLLYIVLSFVFGAILSGVIIEKTAFRIGKRYGFALLLEGIFIYLGMYYLNHNLQLGNYWVSAACGLQNAMISTYSGALIRTTHMTGLFTDIGVMIGNYFRSKQIDSKRLLLYLLLISGFMFGGVVGSLLYQQYAFTALIFPSLFSIFLAVIYWIYLYKRNNQKKESS